MGIINMTFAEVEKALLGVGDPDLLQTTGKDLVSAVNEVTTWA